MPGAGELVALLFRIAEAAGYEILRTLSVVAGQWVRTQSCGADHFGRADNAAVRDGLACQVLAIESNCGTVN